LTAEEHRVMDLTAELANTLGRIVGDGETRLADLGELVGHVHAIQWAILAQAAGRIWPERYRTLGETIAAAEPLPDTVPPHIWS